jgi:ubiquinone/menaquinone biosynthesis C-methylase UbiE
LEAWKRVHSVLSEYTTHDYGNKKIIDISSGTGTMLEVMKYYNHEVMGVDYTHSQNDYIYQDFLISQNIPYIIHDCSKLPYPFEDKQFDVLINWGAFHFYKPMDNWVNIIKEFMRITKETIIVLVNHGPLLEKGRHYFMQQFDGWKLNKNDDNFYKWTDNFFKWTKE